MMVPPRKCHPARYAVTLRATPPALRCPRYAVTLRATPPALRRHPARYAVTLRAVAGSSPLIAQCRLRPM